jgi:hypothetical protein
MAAAMSYGTPNSNRGRVRILDFEAVDGGCLLRYALEANHAALILRASHRSGEEPESPDVDVLAMCSPTKGHRPANGVSGVQLEEQFNSAAGSPKVLCHVLRELNLVTVFWRTTHGTSLDPEEPGVSNGD